jgi:hypothetical protein
MTLDNDALYNIFPSSWVEPGHFMSMRYHLAHRRLFVHVRDTGAVRLVTLHGVSV